VRLISDNEISILLWNVAIADYPDDIPFDFLAKL
jgi:hypothetical protein